MKKIAVVIIGILFSLSALAQTDSIGIYAVHTDLLSRIDLLTHKQIKISSAVVKSKAKLSFNGTTSQNKFNGTAKFRLYFGTPSSYDVAKYYMFTPSYSDKDFSVGKFEVKKGVRYLTTATVSIVSSTIGAKEAKGIAVNSVKLRDNVYEITVTGPAGEYCIMPVLNGAAGYAGVFDFTIE